MKKFIKYILNRPFGRFFLGIISSLYTFTKKDTKFFWIYYQDGVWVHKHNDGVIVDRKISFVKTISNFISETKNIWEFIYTPKEGDIVVDIGAGIGSETYHYSKAVGPNGKVISIEAHPDTFRCLQKFCEFNCLTNVILVNAAIGADESEVFIDNNPKHDSSTIIGTQFGQRVKSLPLDLLMKKLKIQNIDFLKMNIEGYEKLAISGMSKSMKQIKYLCISCHDFKADSEGIEEMRTKNIVKDFLINHDFEIISRDNDRRANIRDQLNGINRSYFSK